MHTHTPTGSSSWMYTHTQMQRHKYMCTNITSLKLTQGPQCSQYRHGVKGVDDRQYHSNIYGNISPGPLWRFLAHAPRINQNQMFDVLGVSKTIGCTQEAPKAMSQQDELLQPHLAAQFNWLCTMSGMGIDLKEKLWNLGGSLENLFLLVITYIRSKSMRSEAILRSFLCK